MAIVERRILELRPSWPVVYAAMLFGLIGALNCFTKDDHQYSRLAASFLEGQLHLLPMSLRSWADTAPFKGYYYLPLGPFPAVLMMPFVQAGYYHQGIFSFIATLSVFYLCFRLARTFDYSQNEACWFALAFCFATSFVGVAAVASSNFFAQVLTVGLLFLAVNEYERKRRLWLIGGLIGLAMASRAPAGLNILFFILATVLTVRKIREKATELITLLLPFSAVVLLLVTYNFARFGNAFEAGYSYQVNGFGMPYATWNVPGNSAGPALSLSYIPGHLWTFLFGLPSVNAIGTSVLLMSPFLVYVSRVRQWDLTNRLIALNAALVLLAVLAFRSTGFEQVGYRFSLDFLPFVFWLLMRSRVNMTDGLKRLIFVSTLVDVGLMLFYLATGVDRRQM